MFKKLYTQIRNEWHSNIWLIAELFIASIVIWFIVDFLYVEISIRCQPKGFDISHCYLLRMGELTKDNPNYVAEDTSSCNDMIEIAERLKRNSDIEAVCLSMGAYPYSQTISSFTFKYDTLQTDNVHQNYASPDFFKVFRYKGSRGETPEQLSILLNGNTFLGSENIFKKEYGVPLTSFIGKEFDLMNDTTSMMRLSATYKTARRNDYDDKANALSIMFLLNRDLLGPFFYNPSNICICIRAKASADKDFESKLWKESKKNINTGNLYISEIKSFENIRTDEQKENSDKMKNYTIGFGFLLINIFLGLLGTFWFRTQERKGEIALMMALGGNKRGIFLRQIAEGLLLLVFATLPAVIVDWNLAYAGLTETMSGVTLETGRFIITVAMTSIISAFTIIAGDLFPALRAMKTQPAVALHDE
ncbi:MAG: ABC transporter permease [Bacteroidales bacterium]|jgi:putative ABC transport system permease protein|nr:ABC transporter permease [Bacteroidales bacterium]